MKCFQRSIFLFIAGFLAASALKAQTDSTQTATHASPTDQAISSTIEDPQWGHTPPIKGDATILHGLDKITARVFSLEAKHGQTIKFGTLRIVVRGCKKNPPEEQPEAAAFIEIAEQKVDDQPRKIFSGWMFASSPAISALDHPVYDVWVTDCIKNSSFASADSVDKKEHNKEHNEVDISVEDLINEQM